MTKKQKRKLLNVVKALIMNSLGVVLFFSYILGLMYLANSNNHGLAWCILLGTYFLMLVLAIPALFNIICGEE